MAERTPFWRLLTKEDVRDHPAQVFLIVALLLATLVLPPVAFVVSTWRIHRATEAVTATVTGVARIAGKRSVRYESTYEYRVDGVSYRGRVGSRIDVGETRTVFVDPAAPQRSYLDHRVKLFWLVSGLFFWGLASLLLCLRGVAHGRELLRPRYAWAFALALTPLSFALPVAIEPTSLWVVPADYLGVLSLTALVLWVRSRRT